MAKADVQKLIERMAMPAIAAPMFLVSNPALTLVCCSEGIMGSFPAHGTRSREEFQAWLDEMVDGIKRLEDAGAEPAPWAVNLVVHSSNPLYRSRKWVNFILLAISGVALAFGLAWLVWILGTLLYEGGHALARATLYYQMTPPPGGCT